MGLVIDTSALVAIERRSAPLSSLVSEPVVLPSIVLAELLVGVALADTAKRAAARRAHIDALTARVQVVDLDAGIAEEWAKLYAILTKRGKMMPSNDLTVAATAMQLDFGVLVGPDNEKHFKLVPELRVESLPL